MDALARSRLKERSTIFVTADHGEAFKEHREITHQNFFGEVHRVPLVAFGPMVRARGRQEIPVQLIDLAPTILNMFGLPYPYPLAGNSLMPLLSTTESADSANVKAEKGKHLLELSWLDRQRLWRLEHRSIYASNHLGNLNEVIEYVIVDQSRWKLIARCRGIRKTEEKHPLFQLFDLENDFFEQNNVIDDHPDLASILLRKLYRWRQQYPPIQQGVIAQDVSFDADQLRDIQNLGYLE